MTPGVEHEARALGQTSKVVVVGNAPRSDTIRLARDQLANLRAPDGRRWLTRSLELDQRTARAVERTLAHAAFDTRDELAQLARVLSQAEAGKTRIHRLVISGHYAGCGVRGNRSGDGGQRNGTLDFDVLTRLVALFPRAASQIKHLMLAICYRGGTNNPALPAERPVSHDVLHSYRAVFPNLVSVTGYASRAPRSGLGAEAHLRRWAAATTDNQAPRRQSIFGRCAPQPPKAGAARRNHFGVVHSDRGIDQCNNGS